jgi:hypothetical protein
MVGRRRLISLLLGALVPGRSSHAQNLSHLGTLTPFYRSTQLQGHLIGMGLVEIPEYLLGQDVDLRYRRNPALREEIPFVDSFTINRFLGGYREDWLKKYRLWNEELGERSLDYVIKGNTGSLEFRPELIRERLAPYLEAGYRPKDITIALENIPWDLADGRRGPHHEGPEGQEEPPRNMRQWTAVISHFAEDLKAYLGSAAADIRFETGVEYDERVSFDASADEFYRYYATTYEGLHAVLPNACLSPGEFTGLGTCKPGETECVYDTQAFIEFARAHQLRVSCVPRSLHSLFDSPNPYPSAAVRRAEISYARIPGTIAEIHQFGLLGQPFGDNSGGDPGAAQANWQFQALIGLWQRVKPRRVFHWGGFSSVGKLPFLNGAGFLRLVLDRYLGSQAILLPIEETNRSTAAPHTELMAVGLSAPTLSAVITSSFSALKSNAGKEVRVRLPQNLFKGNTAGLKVLRYRASDNVFLAIRAHLAAGNNLKAEFASNPSCVADPLVMAKDQGNARSMLYKNWPEYVAIMKRDLKWRANDRETSIDGQLILRARLEANELLVAEVDSRRP